MQDTTNASVLTARPSPLAKTFWGWWFERRVRASFSQVLLAGEQGLRPWSTRTRGRTTEPIILYATHGSWWDAALTIVLSLRTFHLDALGMMEYRQLRRYPFFRSIGMFSVVREDPSSALRSLRYAASELQGRGRALWMFPQGTLVQQDVRPLVVEPGLAMLAKRLPAVWLCPVAMRYELLREQRPEARIVVGRPERVDTAGTTLRDLQRDSAERLEALADRVRADAQAERTEGYRPCYRGPRSMEKQFDHVRSLLRRASPSP